MKRLLILSVLVTAVACLLAGCSSEPETPKSTGNSTYYTGKMEGKGKLANPGSGAPGASGGKGSLVQ